MPLSLEDHLAIRELFSRYNYLVDVVGDAAGVADCFVEDGIYDHGRFGLFRGREEIQGLMQRAVDEQLGYQHWNNNLLIDGEGDEVTSTAYVLTLDGSVDPPVIARLSVVRDSIVRTSQGWRFRERRVGYPVTDFRQ
ncbi:nuclear transport factor 2 family protein [Nocardioides sp.]|uniref:nuclear transport factor 2 family protein n=1 Tax=Nocardioides sp. TaxID=35761 RepID=UPI0039E641FC